MNAVPKMSCRMPVISLVAWEDRGPVRFIFVRVPTERGRYLRTDPCVAYVPCPYNSCGSTVGEPCKHNGRYVGGTHAVRRREGDLRRRAAPLPPIDDVTDQEDGAHVTIKSEARV